MKKIKNIQELWVYAKNKLPKYCKISTVKNSMINSFFDIEIPKANVTKFPEDAKRADLLFTITDTEGEIEILCENNGMIETIVEYAEFDAIVMNTINESVNESKQVFFKCTNENYKNYNVNEHAFKIMCDISNDKSFYIANVYNSQNIQNEGIYKFDELINNLKPIKTKFSGSSSALIYKLKNNGIIIIETGVSEYDKKMYISNNVFENTKLNESAIISIEKNTELTGFTKLIVFSYKGKQKDLEKNLNTLKLKYFVEVYPTSSAGLYCSDKDEKEFVAYINKLNEDAIVGTGKIFSYNGTDVVTTKADNIIQTALKELSDVMGEIKDSTDEESIKAYKSLEDRYNIINSVNATINESLNESATAKLKFVLEDHELSMLTTFFKGQPKEIQSQMDNNFKNNPLYAELLKKYNREIYYVKPTIKYEDLFGNRINIWPDKKLVLVICEKSKYQNYIIEY